MGTSRTIRVSAWGTAIDIVVDTEISADAEGIRRRWQACARSGAARPDEVIRVGGRQAAAPLDEGTILVGAGSDWVSTHSVLTQQVTRAAIRHASGRMLLFHAAGVVDPDSGGAVVLVAPGGTGKTTMARALCSHFRYLSDESIAITSDGLALPYPKPLSIRTGRGRAKSEVSPHDLGLQVAEHPAPVAAVVLLRRSALHEGPAQFVPLEPFHAIMRVVAETSGLSRLPKPLLQLHDLLSNRIVGELHYREAETTSELVAALSRGEVT